MKPSEPIALIASKLLAKELGELGFVKGRRKGAYARPLGKEAVLYFHCTPRSRSGVVTLEPIVALENFRLRELIGDDVPQQKEPAYMHMFLSYTAGSGRTLWTFSDVLGMKQSIESIIRLVKRNAIPFAEKYASLHSAVSLLSLSFRGEAPWGVITHPTPSTRAAVENLLAKQRN